MGIKTFVKESHLRILLRCDNCTAVAYINNYGGCRSSSCHAIAKEIWQWCENSNVHLFASYINTKSNFIADSLSRQSRDMSDFALGSQYFSLICKRFGAPNIDSFASHLTFKCKTFFSWYPDPMSSGVDAFTQTWNSGFYAFPPFCLISKVLKKDNC